MATCIVLRVPHSDDRASRVAQVDALEAGPDGWFLRLAVDEAVHPVMRDIVRHAASLGFAIAPDPGLAPEQVRLDWIDRAIYLNPHRSPSLDVIWDVLHELGHVLQGRPIRRDTKPSAAETRVREDDAWSRGWRLVLERWPRAAGP